MKITPLLLAAVLAVPGSAFAQTTPRSPAEPERSGADITRDLNAAPPVQARPPANPPASPAGARPAAAEAAPSAAPPPSRPASPTNEVPVRPTEGPPASRAQTPPVQAAPEPEPNAEPESESVEPASVGPTILDAAAIGALPFRVDLPTGFRLTEGPSGSNFNIYSARRGAAAFVMIYVGPASQFPIYDGERVLRGGRETVVVTEDERRLALEHLFRSESEPRDIHVWVSSLEGEDRDLAERIAQSVDPR